jgi:hypothetical protein
MGTDRFDPELAYRTDPTRPELRRGGGAGFGGWKIVPTSGGSTALYRRYYGGDGRYAYITRKTEAAAPTFDQYGEPCSLAIFSRDGDEIEGMTCPTVHRAMRAGMLILSTPDVS